MKQKISTKIPREKIVEFCRRNHITKLSLFGSDLSGDFREDSDIDLLVEFDSNHVPGLIRLAGMEIELTEILGRKVDIRTPQDLSRYFRYEVVNNADVQYAEVWYHTTAPHAGCSTTSQLIRRRRQNSLSKMAVLF